ncbi:MAG: signal recognition particle-docking protein FtsY [Methylococcales bacterium]
MLMLRSLAWVGGVLAFIAMLSVVGFSSEAGISFASFFDITNTGLLVHHYSIAASILLVLIFYTATFRVAVNRFAVTLLSLFLLLLLVFDRVLEVEGVFRGGGMEYINPAPKLHFLLNCLLVWLWYWLSLRLQTDIVRLSANVNEDFGNANRGLRWFAVIGMSALLLQNFISTNIVSYDELLSNIQRIWDGLLYVRDSPKPFITFTTQTNIALNLLFSHAVFNSFTSLLLAALAWKTLRNKHACVRAAGICLSILLVVTVLLGIVLTFKLSHTYAFPPVVQLIDVLHTGFATLLMLPLITISFYARYAVVKPEPKLVRPTPSALEQKVDVVVPKTVAVPDADVYVEPAPASLYLRLKSQLKHTRSGLGGVLASLNIGQRKIDADLLEEIEASLIMADIGMDATTNIINRLTEKTERHQLNDADALSVALKHELLDMLQPCSQPLVIPKQDTPYVILVVGINGAGKTTTIGKLAKRLQAQGHSVMLAAGDTFRAAAVEQLQVWGERNNIHVVAQHTGADSASVIYDGVQSALAKKVDVLIADTAGRLHTKSNLMEELKKIKRIMGKLDETAPHEVLLVLDAGTGQNALSQTKLFNEAVALTGLVLTKLDGTAKGGIIFALAKQFGLPIRYIGIGEGIDDLQNFDATAFVDALFVKDD